MKRCTQCGTENQPHENYCYACGNGLNIVQVAAICPNCHTGVGLEDLFCDSCGTKLTPQPSSATMPMLQPSQANIEASIRPRNPIAEQPTYGGSPPVATHTPPASYTPPSYVEKKKKSKLSLILVILVIFVLAGGGIYYYLAQSSSLPASFPLVNSKSDRGSTDQESGTTTVRQPTDVNDRNNKSPTNTPTQPANSDSDRVKNNTGGKSAGYGFSQKYSGTITEPFLHYHAGDIDADGKTELVISNSDLPGSWLKVLSFDKKGFVEKHHVNIPGTIAELNASRPELPQYVYVSSDNKAFPVYLDLETNQIAYEQIDFPAQPYAIIEGYLDEDDQVDMIVFSEQKDGSLVLSVTTSKDQGDVYAIDSYITNMFMADFDGDGLSEVIYTGYDTVESYASILFWDGKMLRESIKTTFGGGLMSYFPWDLDGDGMSELVTANVADSGINILIWSYDLNSQQFQMVEQILVEDDQVIFVGLLAGDFDSDGKVEILAITFGSDIDSTGFIMYGR